jgi:hypothetical protein
MLVPINTRPRALPFQVHLMFFVFLPFVLVLNNKLKQRLVLGFFLFEVNKIFFFTHYSNFLQILVYNCSHKIEHHLGIVYRLFEVAHNLKRLEVSV